MKISRIVWSFSLIAILFVLINNTLYLHTHELPDGRVIEHAHPFQSSENNSESFPNHKHTSQELFLLNQIFNSFSWAITVLLFTLFYKKLLSIIYNYECINLHPNYNKNKLSTRAPPQLLFTL